MNTLTALRLALRALAANKLRSILTMLGIIIGVAAVITMIAIGQGATDRVHAQMRSLGTNLMLVLPGAGMHSGVRGAQAGRALTDDDALAIAREVPEVQAAAPAMRVAVQVVAGNANWGTTAYGTTNEYLETRDWPLAAGRLFEPVEIEGAAKVAIIGQTVAQQLFGDDADPIDQVMRLNRVPVIVVGLLDKKGQSAAGHDQDDVVIVPISTYRNRVQGGGGGRLKRAQSIGVKVRDGHVMKAAQEGVRALLRQRFGVQPGAEDPFSIRNLTEILQAQEESSRVMTILLATVAGISLVIGGIGIINIMLVSVTERTREIGLRMAVGARSRDILSQFLVEAVALSLIGGAIGVVLGAAATWAVGHFAGWQVSMTASSILLAAAFSGCVGVFFGFYPARRASRLLPIEALRHE